MYWWWLTERWCCSEVGKKGDSAGALMSLMSLWVKALVNLKYSWVWTMHWTVISRAIMMIVLGIRTGLFSGARAEGLIQVNWLAAENNIPGVMDSLLSRDRQQLDWRMAWGTTVWRSMDMREDFCGQSGKNYLAVMTFAFITDGGNLKVT